MSALPCLERLRGFVADFSGLLSRTSDEAELLHEGEALLAELLKHDDWLPAAYAQPDPGRYQQYLLYADAQERLSVVSFVWGPGQGTPVHDHRVWGLVGVLRGAEDSQRYRRDADGALHPFGPPQRLLPGQVEAVSPRIGDIHSVRNAYPDRSSISIHVYGGNIGAVRRAVYAEDGSEKVFVSGYSNQTLPNLWNGPLERAA
ncbi:MAG: cysteine dioxygenase [Pseudomonas sp.]